MSLLDLRVYNIILFQSYILPNVKEEEVVFINDKIKLEKLEELNQLKTEILAKYNKLNIEVSVAIGHLTNNLMRLSRTKIDLIVCATNEKNTFGYFLDELPNELYNNSKLLFMPDRIPFDINRMYYWEDERKQGTNLKENLNKMSINPTLISSLSIVTDNNVVEKINNALICCSHKFAMNNIQTIERNAALFIN